MFTFFTYDVATGEFGFCERERFESWQSKLLDTHEAPFTLKSLIKALKHCGIEAREFKEQGDTNQQITREINLFLQTYLFILLQYQIAKTNPLSSDPKARYEVILSALSCYKIISLQENGFSAAGVQEKLWGLLLQIRFICAEVLARQLKFADAWIEFHLAIDHYQTHSQNEKTQHLMQNIRENLRLLSAHQACPCTQELTLVYQVMQGTASIDTLAPLEPVFGLPLRAWMTEPEALPNSVSTLRTLLQRSWLQLDTHAPQNTSPSYNALTVQLLLVLFNEAYTRQHTKRTLAVNQELLAFRAAFYAIWYQCGRLSGASPNKWTLYFCLQFLLEAPSTPQAHPEDLRAQSALLAHYVELNRIDSEAVEAHTTYTQFRKDLTHFCKKQPELSVLLTEQAHFYSGHALTQADKHTEARAYYQWVVDHVKPDSNPLYQFLSRRITSASAAPEEADKRYYSEVCEHIQANPSYLQQESCKIFEDFLKHGTYPDDDIRKARFAIHTTLLPVQRGKILPENPALFTNLILDYQGRLRWNDFATFNLLLQKIMTCSDIKFLQDLCLTLKPHAQADGEEQGNSPNQILLRQLLCLIAASTLFIQKSIRGLAELVTVLYQELEHNAEHPPFYDLSQVLRVFLVETLVRLERYSEAMEITLSHLCVDHQRFIELQQPTSIGSPYSYYDAVASRNYLTHYAKVTATSREKPRSNQSDWHFRWLADHCDDRLGYCLYQLVLKKELEDTIRCQAMLLVEFRYHASASFQQLKDKIRCVLKTSIARDQFFFINHDGVDTNRLFDFYNPNLEAFRHRLCLYQFTDRTATLFQDKITPMLQKMVLQLNELLLTTFRLDYLRQTGQTLPHDAASILEVIASLVGSFCSLTHLLGTANPVHLCQEFPLSRFIASLEKNTFSCKETTNYRGLTHLAIWHLRQQRQAQNPLEAIAAQAETFLKMIVLRFPKNIQIAEQSLYELHLAALYLELKHQDKAREIYQKHLNTAQPYIALLARLHLQPLMPETTDRESLQTSVHRMLTKGSYALQGDDDFREMVYLGLLDALKTNLAQVEKKTASAIKEFITLGGYAVTNPTRYQQKLKQEQETQKKLEEKARQILIKELTATPTVPAVKHKKSQPKSKKTVTIPRVSESSTSLFKPDERSVAETPVSIIPADINALTSPRAEESVRVDSSVDNSDDSDEVFIPIQYNSDDEPIKHTTL
jgi:hypothetical protein